MEPRLLMAQRAGHDPTEAEPVLVDVGDADVTLRLDDGEVLTFNRAELRSVMDEAA